MKLSKAEWIERYGGQALLDAEGFAVLPCDPATCTDSICHGWRVVPLPQAARAIIGGDMRPVEFGAYRS